MRNLPDPSRKRRRSPRSLEDLYIPEPNSGCWLFLGALTHNGYGKLRGADGDYRDEKAHRVFYERTKGPIPAGLQLDHLCKVTSCVNPDHLEVVTGAINCQRGRNAKLSPDKIRQIRALTAAGETQRQVAARFGVSQMAVCRVSRGATWRNVS